MYNLIKKEKESWDIPCVLEMLLKNFGIQDFKQEELSKLFKIKNNEIVIEDLNTELYLKYKLPIEEEYTSAISLMNISEPNRYSAIIFNLLNSDRFRFLLFADDSCIKNGLDSTKEEGYNAINRTYIIDSYNQDTNEFTLIEPDIKETRKIVVPLKNIDDCLKNLSRKDNYYGISINRKH